jgi:hypothetical protein
MARAHLEWSKKRPRAVVRVDEGGPIPAPEESVPVHEPGSTRFAKGNRGWRLREVKRKAKGIATLAPATCSAWLRPHVEHGAGYIAALVATVDARPVLHALAGDVADAHTVFRALLSEASRSDGPGRLEALQESRAWMREHRASLATLCALAGDLDPPATDPHAAIEAIAREERERAK